MTDRLDGRIRAFVVELVDDPLEAPPFPHSDVVVIRGDRSHRRRAMETAPTTTEQRKPWWRGPRVAFGVVAATAVVVLAGFAIVALVDSDEPFASADGLSVADAYFEAYNAGDVEAVLALFEPDATFSGDFGPWVRADWEQLLVWNAAQGTALTAPDCIAVDEVAGESVTVSCPHENLDALVQAHAACGVPIQLTLTVTPDGISDWVSFFGDPNFDVVGVPFTSWVSREHPEDVDAVRFGNWTSVEEAKQN